MLKAFCDMCQKEINGTSDRLRRKKGNISIEVMVCVNGTWNAGHVCDMCTLDIINTGKVTKDEWPQG